MQPQSPYGPPQPYNPQDPRNQPQDPNRLTSAPGPGMPGQAYPVAGQPPLPPYTMPPGLDRQQPQAENLPPPPPAPTTPYDFFLDQPKPHAPASPLSPGGRRYGAVLGNSQRNRFLLIAVASLTVIILLMLVITFLPKDPTAQQWFAIAQRQQELVRICSQGSKAKYQATRNFAITCQTGVTGNQRELLSYMKKAGFSYNEKELDLKQDTRVDTRLKSATASSTFDDAFREVVETQLTSYDRALTAQLASTSGPDGREVLTKNQRSTELLLQMVRNNSDKTEAPVAES